MDLMTGLRRVWIKVRHPRTHIKGDDHDPRIERARASRDTAAEARARRSMDKRNQDMPPSAF